MPGSAHLAGQTLQDRHIVPVFVERSHPSGQFVIGQSDFERLLLVFFDLVSLTERLRYHGFRKQTVAFVHEDKSRRGRFCRFTGEQP